MSSKTHLLTRIAFGRRNIYLAVLQELESRCLLSTIAWSNLSGGDWNTGSNWTGGQVPGAADNAVINVAGNPTISFNSGTDSVLSIQSSDTLAIAGGTLTVTNGSSTLTNLTLSNDGTLVASGAGTTLTASGATNISGGGLLASGGASITLPSATSFVTGTGFSSTLQATGSNSVLDLANVTTITGSSNYGSGVTVEATSGGQVNLSGLTSINAQASLSASGPGSVLNISLLSSFAATDTGFGSALSDSSSASVQDGDLTSLSGLTLSTDSTGTMPISQLTSVTNSQINVTSGTQTFTSLSDLDGSGVRASGGSDVAFPALTNYATPTSYSVSLEAAGTGSVLNLSQVTSISGSSTYGSGTTVEASGGGDVNLSSLTLINAQASLIAAGVNSSINVSALTNFTATQTGFGSSLDVNTSGTILAGSLATLDGVNLDYNGVATLVLPDVANITGTNITIEGGAVLAFPSVTTYQTLTSNNNTLEATGIGSILDLSHITTITGSSAYGSGVLIEALAGGDVNLTSLTSITAQAYLESDGANSTLNISSLTTFTATDTGFDSTLRATNGGTVNDADLIVISGGTLSLDGTGTYLIAQITSFTSGQINVTGGTETFTDLNDFDASGANVSSGADAAFPALLSYATLTSNQTTLEATGTGSILDLSHITTITGSSAYGSGVNIEALAGGDVKLSSLTTITAQAYLESDGASSTLNISALTTFTATNTGFGSTLRDTDNGTVNDGDLATLNGVTLSLDGSGTMPIAQITSFTSGQINISGGTETFTDLNDFDASGAYVSGGSDAAFPALTSYTTNTGNQATLEANGTGSILDLSSITGITGSSNYGSGVQIKAFGGGSLDLSALTTITAQVYLQSDGSGSTLNLSHLTNFTGTNTGFGSAIVASNSGNILSGDLTSLSGVALTINTSGTMNTSQLVSFKNNTISVTGSTPSFAALDDLDGAGVNASGGADLAFPSLTSYTTGDGFQQTIEADGAGSLINLSSVTTIGGSSDYGSGATFEALAGGSINLDTVITINGHVALYASGTGSVLNLADLTQYVVSDAGFGSSLQASSGGNIETPGLTKINGVTITSDGTGTLNVSNVSDISSTNITVTGGTLAFPSLVSYSTPTGTSVTLKATGSSSVLDLSNISSINGSSTYGSGVNIQALAGGNVKLTSLTGITAQAYLESDGVGSSLNISSLSSFTGTDTGFGSTVQSSNSGAVLASDLHVLSGVTLNDDGTGSMTTNQITSFTSGQLNISGGTPGFAALSTFDGSGVTVSNAATLALPALTAYVTLTSNQTTLEATGTGSVLNLSHLASITGSSTYGSGVNIEALAGGSVNLPALTSITAQVSLQATGTGSVLNTSDLTSYVATNLGFNSAFQASNGGTIESGSLTSLNGVQLTYDGTGPLSVPLLSNINGSTITVSAGTLALPAVTTYITPISNQITLQATGAGSVLDLSHLTTITGSFANASGVNIEALAGGDVKLNALTTIDAQAFLEASGTGSTLNVPSLTAFTGGNAGFTSALESTNNGTVDFLNLVWTNTGITTLNGTIGASAGSIVLSAGSATITTTSGDITGSLAANNGSTLVLAANLDLTGSYVLTSQYSSTIQITGNLLGSTTNASGFAPAGRVLFNGTGSVNSPQLLEAMSADDGAVASGFTNNFAYSTLALANNTYVQLVNQSQNSGGSGNEAVYVNSLIVPAGSTLDLNGLHLYARVSEIAGSVVNGSVTQAGEGGALVLGTPTQGNIGSTGALQAWSFYGRQGNSVTVQVNPGSGGTNPPASPYLNNVLVNLVDPSGTLIASGTMDGGNSVTLSGVSLPANGTYSVQIGASTDQPSSLGNYTVTVYSAVTTTRTLTLGQTETGTLSSAYSEDEWTFAGTAGEQVQFNFINSTGGIVFDLSNGNGADQFTGISGNSGTVTLPSNGTYTLTARINNGSNGGSYAFSITQTSITALTLGTPATATLSGMGQQDLYSVSLPATTPLNIVLDGIAGDHEEVYARFGSVPTPANYDYVAATAGAMNQQLLIPSATVGTWYILVYADNVPNTGTYTITAAAPSVSLSSSTPSTYGTGASPTIVLSGAGFGSGTSVELVGTGGTFTASSVEIDSPTQMSATFASGLPLGTYTIQVTGQGNSTADLSNAFTVVAGSTPNLVYKLTVPSTIGYHISSTLYLTYSNTGTAAMPAPLLVVTATQDGVQGAIMTLNASLVTSGFWTSAIPEGYSNSVQVLASGSVPGMLEPGDSVTVPIYYAGWQQPYNFAYPPIDFGVQAVTTASTVAVDWNSVKAATQPANISTAAWNVIWPNFLAQVGSTAGQYVQFLDISAAYLGKLGENVTDINALFGMAIDEVDGLTVNQTLVSSTDVQIDSPVLPLSFVRSYEEPISDRYVLGPLGYGWSDNWQISLAMASDGTVTVTQPDGSQEVFQPDSRPDHGYFDQPGDYATLADTGNGTFTLTETNGIVYSFNADGTLAFEQDTNGNRITLAYSSGKLASLTASAAPSLDITYNAAGLISTITDSAGRTTTYTYDSSNQYLMSVQDFAGRVTSYTYNTSSGTTASHALTQLVNPDGTQENFNYDSIGRLVTTSYAGGVGLTTYTYGPGAEVTSTDALGDATSYFFDGNGLLVKYVDPLGNTTLMTYDVNDNLVQTIDPADVTTDYTYDGHGNLIKTTNALGAITQYTYTNSNQLASLTDAKGNVTQYSYNPSGDLQSVILANGTEENWSYDAEGLPTGWTSPAGVATSYSYDSSGHLLTETYADDSTITYTYDADGNVLTATDASGTITMTYNADDTLASITYPNGNYLHYTYDSAGRCTQMVDQSGDATNYQYTTAGQLTDLIDQNGTTLVEYFYNAAGQLVEQDNSDHTSTDYTYDADGNLLSVINRGIDNIINSEFTYTYDSSGRAVTETTLDGTWTYTYDDLGELTHAVFVSTNQGIEANQDLTYVYDAVGNRIAAIENGTTSDYTSNNLDEYTTVGSTTYAYDADGNLISSTTAGVTTTYSYNDRNQLVGVSGGGSTLSFQYNALDQLAESIINGTTLQNLIDPTGVGNIVAQFNGSNTLIASYTYGLGLVSQSTGGNTYFYDFDGSGNTADITSSSGNVVNSYTYLPFGQTNVVLSGIANSFAFAGKFGVIADDNGLLSMRARTYSAELGDFLSNDPLGLLSNSNNFREYAGNNPISRDDPSGLVSQFIGFSGGLGLDVTLGVIWNDDGTAFGTFGVGGTTGGVTVYQANSGNATAGDSVTFSGTLGAGLIGATASNALSTKGYSGSVGVSLGAKVPGWTVERNHIWRFPPLDVPPGPGPDPEPVPPHDPNAKAGPSGYGADGFIPASGVLPYTVYFENDPTAAAPAQEVTVTDQLNSNLNWNTFALTSLGFGDTIINVPAGSGQNFQTTVSTTYDGDTFNVEIDAGINLSTGLVYADFYSIDPNTSLPPPVLIGFLPPEDGTGRGEGYVSYSVALNSNLPTGTQISNVAGISFNDLPIITTDQVNDDDASQGTTTAKEDINTIDAVSPTSTVTALPTDSSTTFIVSWSGADDAGGSGIGSYDIYVSDNGGAYTLWQSDTSAMSASYTGIIGDTYSFYSVATDNVGNVEATPTAAEASTTVTQAATTTATPTQLAFSQQPSNTTAGQAISPAIVVNVENSNGDIVTTDNSAVTIAIATGPAGATLGGTLTVNAVNGVATFTGLSLTQAGTYSFTVADGVLTAGTSGSFTIDAGSPASVTLSSQPTNSTAGTDLSLVVEVEDAYGNPVSGANVTVSIAAGPSNAMIAGTLTVATVNGVATFSNLTVDRAGNYTLSAASGSASATTSSFAIAYSGPQLVFDVEPANISAGSKLPTMTVSTDDASGTLITAKSKTKVKLTILSGPAGAKLTGGTTSSIKDGHAIFKKIAIDKAGTYVLEATGSGFGTGDSITFTVTAAAVKKLAFVSQPPAQLGAGSPFSTQLQLVDRYGNVATDNDSTVTLTLGAHAKGSILDGILTDTVTDGLATFSNLSLDSAGKYTLSAIDGKLKAKSKKVVVS